MNILADASLPGLTAAFPHPFNLTIYHDAREISGLLTGQDILLCRSTLNVDASLLGNHHLKFVATASSGTDHLDHNYLHAQNIRILDAKGCNATSVGDYVIASLALLDQQQLIKGSVAGIIGMGKVGTEVYTRLNALNLQIKTYDPLKAIKDPHFSSCALRDLYDCDILCIHAELHDTNPHPSFNLINKEFLNQLKPDCIIINAARGGIVNEQDLLDNKQSLAYCTDVYLNEPQIDAQIISKATLCTPHIAGHSLEAKYAAVNLISEQLHNIAQLPIPIFAKPETCNKVTIPEKQPWQETLLSLYNPMHETLKLKNATNKEQEFIALRKQHQNRHDFTVYFD